MSRNRRHADLKASPDLIRRMAQMAATGMGDARIAEVLGCSEHTVEMALARVAPDGRVMDTIYGDLRNEPDYQRPIRKRPELFYGEHEDAVTKVKLCFR